MYVAFWFLCSSKLVAVFVGTWIARRFLCPKFDPILAKDDYFSAMKQSVQNWAGSVSMLLWFLFVPYNIKIYFLGLMRVPYTKFLLPAMLFIAFHS